MDRTELFRPAFKQETRLLSTRDTGYQTYFAFPALKRIGDYALITVKTGHKHWGDELASLTQIKLDIPSQQITDTQVIYSQTGLTPQMGEIVQMPDGDICVYIDMQKSTTSVRTGLWELRSHDQGRTYVESRPIGVVNGVEYGYAMDMAEKDGIVYLLAMTFDYQIGGLHRQVHVLSSKDSGRTWAFCANLTETFGFPFNECTLLACDTGFYIFTRGEADRGDRKNSLDDFASGQHLVVLDNAFRVLRMRDYRHTTSFFTLTGRPRLYSIQGELCLFTRQWNENAENRMMSLDMFRIDPNSMDIRARVRLDAPRFPHQDGHYPVVYTEGNMLHVVTYVTCDRDERESFEQKCDLVQLSFHLDEVMDFGKEE